MSVKKQNLSDFSDKLIPSASNMKFGIIVSEWNKEVTNALLEGAISTLIKHGAKKENIIVEYVPGSFELVLGAQIIAENNNIDSILCLGCVIQGETRHFEFICHSVSKGIIDLNIKFNIPVIFGVLTTDNLDQALQRSGGKHGNKGDEAAIAGIKMVALKNKNL
ncbi:6,7-dimethyl-8-ribityllumazine synthase [Bacteroidota bacterium]